jgi:excisionase family DNA binding protein
MNNLLKTDEVAELLKVKKSTIYSLVHRNKIPHIKISHKILRFRQSEIEAWLDRAHSAPTHERAHKRTGQREMKQITEGSEGLTESIIEAAKKEVLGA